MARSEIMLHVRAECETAEEPCFLAHPEQPACGWVHRRLVGITYYVNDKPISKESYEEIIDRMAEEARGF